MKMRHLLLLLLICCLLQISPVEMQGVERRIGNFREVFAWRQLTYNINGNLVLQDRFSENDVDDTKERDKRETDSIIFNNNDNDRTNWNNPNQGNAQGQQHWPSWGANTLSTNSGFHGVRPGFQGHNSGFHNPNSGFSGLNAGFQRPNSEFGGTNPGFSGINSGFQRPNTGFQGITPSFSNFQGTNPNFQGNSNFQGNPNFQGNSNFQGNPNYQGNPDLQDPSFSGMNTNFQTPNSGFQGTNPSFSNSNSGLLGTNTGFQGTNPPFSNSNSALQGTNPGFQGTNTAFSNPNAALQGTNSGFQGTNTAFPETDSGIQNTNPGFSGLNLASGFPLTNTPNWLQNDSSVFSDRPWATSSGRPNSSTAATNEDAGRFFIQYNNLPMGVERVGNRLFVTVPRRRYGIPSTLNYINLDENRNTRSPALSPYPSLRDAGLLTSVYRTRADECGRLWMVDTGLLEIPNNPQQVRPPAIVIFDLESNTQILRYELNGDLLPAANTPTGLASITVDVTNGDCAGAYAYIPDLTTYGIIVFSLRDNDSWRLSHNYFHFNPTAGNLRIAGQRFQWSDGIFSITLTEATSNGCKVAYFHPMVSTQEFSVSTCVLKNRTASSDSDYWSLYSVVGDRGESSQSTMHGYHAGSKTIFFADISRNAISCWNTALPLMSTNVAILAQDTLRLSYPSDLHVTGDEVWVMANTLPRWGYSRLDTNEYNFYIYRGSVRDLITGTTCAGTSSYGMG